MKKIVERVSLPVFAVSLGAVESILSYPAKNVTRRYAERRAGKRGITDGLLRLSVGVEHADDLQADFARALEAVSGAFARS